MTSPKEESISRLTENIESILLAISNPSLDCLVREEYFAAAGPLITALHGVDVSQHYYNKVVRHYDHLFLERLGISDTITQYQQRLLGNG
jgi:hypothetical protein